MNLNFRFEDTGADQTVVLLHGFMGQMDDWQLLKSKLKKSADVLLIDLPGHGASPVSNEETSEWNFPAFFDAFNNLLQQLNVRKIHLLGYSMGGRLALYWAVSFPQMVQSLILESANPGISNPAERNARWQADVALSERMSRPDFDFNRFLNEWYAQPLFGQLKQHPAFNDLLQRRLQNKPTQLALALKGFSVGRQPSLWPHLTEIKQPVLLICGALDEKYAQITAAMQTHNPAFKRKVAEGCGHNVHFENPSWMARQVNEFLDEVERKKV